MPRGAPKDGNGKRLVTQQSVKRARCSRAGGDLDPLKGREVAEAVAALRALSRREG